MAATFNIRDKFDVGFTILRLPRSWLRKVAGFLNYFTAGDYIDITKPDNPSLETPVKVSVAYAALLAQLQKDIGGDVPDNVLTTDDIGVSVASQEDFTELHDDTQQLADDFDAHLLDFEDLSDIVDGILAELDGYLTVDDIGVTVAEEDHTHTTADISDWGTATQNFLTDADMSAYALEADLLDLASEVVDMASEIIDINDDLDDLYSWYGTGVSSGSFTLGGQVVWDGTKLTQPVQTVSVANGLITQIGTTSTKTIDTPILFEQS